MKKTPSWKPRLLKSEPSQGQPRLKPKFQPGNSQTLIDFDQLFKTHLSAWFEKNQFRYADMDAMEADMPEEYLRWLKKPNIRLNGLAPQAYFQHLSPKALVAQLLRYVSHGVALPDPLLERIAELGDPQPLYEAMQHGDEEVRVLCINLLEEMQAKHPVALYVEWIAQMQPGDSVADAAAEKLYDPSISPDAMDRLLEALADAPSLHSQDCLLDILSHYPPHDMVLTRLLRSFELRREKAALYASLLGRYGQDSAIPVLVAALDWREINYLDYLEIRNAVESLGGTVRHSREFSGDPYFETLKNLEDSEAHTDE